MTAVTVNVVGIASTSSVGQAIVYGRIVPDQVPNYTEITPSQSPTWSEDVPNQSAYWAKIAA